MTNRYFTNLRFSFFHIWASCQHTKSQIKDNWHSDCNTRHVISALGLNFKYSFWATCDLLNVWDAQRVSPILYGYYWPPRSLTLPYLLRRFPWNRCKYESKWDLYWTSVCQFSGIELLAGHRFIRVHVDLSIFWIETLMTMHCTAIQGFRVVWISTFLTLRFWENSYMEM